jgi:hypothetical protein
MPVYTTHRIGEQVSVAVWADRPGGQVLWTALYPRWFWWAALIELRLRGIRPARNA